MVRERPEGNLAVTPKLLFSSGPAMPGLFRWCVLNGFVSALRQMSDHGAGVGDGPAHQNDGNNARQYNNKGRQRAMIQAFIGGKLVQVGGQGFKVEWSQYQSCW